MEPKNSLEALDNLVHCKSETRCKECHHKNVCTLERDYNIIKVDLENLNELKKVWNTPWHQNIPLNDDNLLSSIDCNVDLFRENRKLKKEIAEWNELNKKYIDKIVELEKQRWDLEQDIKDVIADYQDAARKMFKYIEAIDEILDYLKSHDVSIDFLSDIENIVARAGYYD